MADNCFYQCVCGTFFATFAAANNHTCSKREGGTAGCSDSQDAITGNSAVNLMVEKGTNWTDSQTLLLIDCYKGYVSLVNSGKMKKKTMWDTIGSKFQDMGYGFGSEQKCGRWKSLMRAYKNTKDSNKKSGSCRKTFEYEDQLDELFAKDPTIQPECTLSSNSTTVSKGSASDETDKDDDSSSSSTPEVPKKKASRSNASELVTLFKTYLKKRKREKRKRKT
ncbi:uncharacterized protein LOC128219290 [Mya arenaria]|uniref:uncharacterized protein LOC128219290 n=2 Tax=Mya arenaria TaxID=6604 RepID=UPI0022DF0935|nr:uncharacterized protein LOC128219290 [Mya arenaria]